MVGRERRRAARGMRGAAVRAPATAAAPAAYRPPSRPGLPGTAPASGMPCASTTAAFDPASPRGAITITTGRTPTTTITRGITRHGMSIRRRRITVTTGGTTRHGMGTRRRRITSTTRGTTRRNTATRIRRTISTTPGTTRHGTGTTATGTTMMESTTTARAEAASSDRFDALDVPHDPGALGLLRLHDARAGRERHLAELA